MMQRKRTWIGLAMLGLLVLGAGAGRAEDGEGVPVTLKGPAFSDPDQLADKPEAWRQLPIRHKPPDEGAELAILLDQNNYPALLPLIREYAAVNRIDISLREGTCGPAMEGINRKQVDIGASCCPVAQADRLPGLRWHTIGIAPLAILANGEDPVEGLTTDEVRRIFRGKVTRWSQIPSVAGKFPEDAPVFPVIRFHCKTRPGHWRLILDNEELFGPRAEQVGSMLDMVTNVAKRRGALGYEENWHTINQPEFRERLRTLRIDGHSPLDREAVRTGRYPFYFVYTLSTWTEPHTANPKADALVRFLIGQAGRIDPAYHVIPAAELRGAGWKFRDDELIGEP
ncbi:MAG: hypothetical protein HQL96_05605 [Magnetococcales bacterium]|nr:hypothetical protein [Magnetococcales bacterium]